MLPIVDMNKLEGLAIDLAIKASGLASQIPQGVRQSVGDFFRTMNCYYSHQLAGLFINPRDIDAALTCNDYSKDQQQNLVQKHAIAFIEVLRLIDNHEDLQDEPTSIDYLSSLHREFGRHIPKELRIINSIDGPVPVSPGVMRTEPSGALISFLNAFAKVHDTKCMSKVRQIVFIGNAYQSILWAKPFIICNEQVALHMFHAILQRCGIEPSFWSIARGLIMNNKEYQGLLSSANYERTPGANYSGARSRFCEFILTTCIKEIDFMRPLLEPRTLLNRMRQHVEYKELSGELPKGSFKILREALLAGEVPRGRVQEVLCLGERTARSVVSALQKAGYLQSKTTRSPLVLKFPLDAADWLFPRLYDIQIG